MFHGLLSFVVGTAHFRLFLVGPQGRWLTLDCKTALLSPPVSEQSYPSFLLPKHLTCRRNASTSRNLNIRPSRCKSGLVKVKVTPLSLWEGESLTDHVKYEPIRILRFFSDAESRTEFMYEKATVRVVSVPLQSHS